METTTPVLNPSAGLRRIVLVLDGAGLLRCLSIEEAK